MDVEKAENLKSYVQLVEIAQLIMDLYLGKLVWLPKAQKDHGVVEL